MMDESSTLPVAVDPAPRRVSTIAELASIPEEEIWLSKQKSAGTRRAYRLDVQHFMRTLAITTPVELRQADHKAVIAWERFMRETEHAAAATIRRRLAALSSLYKHLVRHDHAARNPVGEVERPAINRDAGSFLAFAKAQARKLLDLPREDTIAGLRDRAILSVGLQVGLQRVEIAALTVGDLHQNSGYDLLLRVLRKGGRRDATGGQPADRGATARLPRCRRAHGGHRRTPVPPAQAQRQAPGQAPTHGPGRNRSRRPEIRRRALARPRLLDARTFITTALENRAQPEDMQKAAGHRDSRTTKLYDRRGYNPEKAASFFATY
jgi:integrase/recombinase XerD